MSSSVSRNLKAARSAHSSDNTSEASSKSSLLKYDTPIGIKQKSKTNSSTASEENASDSSHKFESAINKSSLDDEFKSSDILDILLPPKKWIENNKLWVQRVSSTPATRQDIVNLEKELDLRLYENNAKLAGICPVRRKLFMQCFDEIIRQVAINCAERGQLLGRIKEELYCTLNAYETLYESSVAFGIRKAIQSDSDRQELECSKKDLKEINENLTRELQESKKKHEVEMKKMEENRQFEERKHNEELQFLKRTNQQLKNQIEAILSLKNQ
ncbi:MAG: Axonemal dynein light intermediate polypeptide 1 [Marteilia pararefringens]